MKMVFQRISIIQSQCIQECYKDLGFHKGDFPIAEEISSTQLSIPIYYGMTDDETQYVIDTINSFK